MKNIICLLVICFVSLFVQLNAQTYKQNKLVYNPKLYVPEYPDPYDPALCGIASLFIPGLGQMLAGEVGRGFAFLGGNVAFGAVAVAGSIMMSFDYTNNYDSKMFPSGLGLALVGTLGMLSINIWSITDAVRVAKVNNMYIRDLRKTTAMEVSLSPYVGTVAMHNEVTNPVGLALKISF